MEKTDLFNIIQKFNKLGLVKEIKVEDVEEDLLIKRFLTSIESLSEEDESKLPDEIFDAYESICNSNHQKEEIIIQSKDIKMSNEGKTEKKEALKAEQVTKMLEVIKFWKENGFADVTVPDELTHKELKALFLGAINGISFETKMAGALTADIYEFEKSLLKTARSGGKRGISAEEQAKELAKIQDLLNCITILNNYMEDKVEVADPESLARTETQFLEMLLGGIEEDSFVEAIKEINIAKQLRRTCIEREVSGIVLKAKRKTKIFKKWDGNGEPFAELTPKKEKSMTFAIWEKIQEKEFKLTALNKWLNKEFGKSSKGKDREITRTLVKMSKKVADFYTLEVGETVKVTKVA